MEQNPIKRMKTEDRRSDIAIIDSEDITFQVRSELGKPNNTHIVNYCQ